MNSTILLLGGEITPAGTIRIFYRSSTGSKGHIIGSESQTSGLHALYVLYCSHMTLAEYQALPDHIEPVQENLDDALCLGIPHPDHEPIVGAFHPLPAQHQTLYSSPFNHER